MNFPGFSTEGLIIKLNEPIKNQNEYHNSYLYKAEKQGEIIGNWHSPSYINDSGKLDFHFNKELPFILKWRLAYKMIKIGVKFY
jgi:hypothetical protein